MSIPYPPQRQLSVAEVLDLGFRIYRATVLSCLLFASCGVIAGELVNIYALIKSRTVPRGAGVFDLMRAQLHDPTFVTLYIVGVVLTLVFSAAIVLRAQAIITSGTRGGELSVALRRTPALIGLVVIVIVGLCACFVPGTLAAGGLRALLFVAGAIAVSYGLVAISCAQTIVLVDGEGPASSLARSWRLTAGWFWHLGVIYTVALIVLSALYANIGGVAVMLAAVLVHGDVAIVTALAQVIGIILGAVATPFYAALALAVLANLKVRKEGADLAQRIAGMA